MAKLYREHVLGEKPTPGLVSLESLSPAPLPPPNAAPSKPPVAKVEEREEVGSFGD
jgi:hypothetical protein